MCSDSGEESEEGLSGVLGRGVKRGGGSNEGGLLKFC